MPKRVRLKDQEGNVICDSSGFSICVPCQPVDAECDAGCPEWMCGTGTACLEITGLRSDAFPLATPADLTIPLEFICDDELRYFYGFIDVDDGLGIHHGCECCFPSPLTVIIYCGQTGGVIGGEDGDWYVFFYYGCCISGTGSSTIGPITLACPGFTYGAFSNTDDAACGSFEFDGLEMTNVSCSHAVTGSCCGTPVIIEPPVPPPESVCCPDLFPSGEDPFLRIPGLMSGLDNGAALEPNCDPCATTPIEWWFYQNGSIEAGFIVQQVVCGKALDVRLTCDFVSGAWTLVFKWDGVTYPDAQILTPPCSEGFPQNYAAVSLNISLPHPDPPCIGSVVLEMGV